MNDRYEDIIHLRHHVSPTRPRMSMADRAAQFSPFAALTGYDDAIQETGRLTEEKIELTEDELDALNRKFQVFAKGANTKAQVRITYFIPDRRKSGGSYVTEHCTVKKLDMFDRLIFATNETIIPMDAVLDIAAEE